MRLSQTHILFDRLLLLLLVFSGGGLLFVYNRNPLSVFLLVLALFVVIFMGKKIKKSIFNSSFFALSFMSFLVIINYLIAPASQKLLQYGFILLNVTSCVVILTHLRNNRTYNYFLKSIRFILLVVLYHSLFNFFAYFLVKNSLTELVSETHTVSTFYYLFYFEPVKHAFNFLGLELIRNQGWFWEPGILQVYLNILLYLEGFIFKRKKVTLFLIVIAIFSTYSTTGILIMLTLLFFMFKSTIRRNPIMAILLISLILPVYFIAKTNVERKVEGEKSSSFQKRYLDLIQPTAIAFKHPLTGVGLDREHFQRYRSEFLMDDNFGSFIEKSTGYERQAESTEKGSSNSITYLMAAMGFPISIFLIYCLFKQKLFTHKKEIFMLVVIISILSEPLLLRPFFLILILSGMMSFFNKFIK